MPDLNSLCIEMGNMSPVERRQAGLIRKYAQENERGFLRLSWRDRYGQHCSLQESSLASEACVWLGEDGSRMHLTRRHAQVLAEHLAYFAEHGVLRSKSPA